MVSCGSIGRNHAMSSFRLIPSIDQLLRRAALQDLIARHGHAAVADAARRAADDLRAQVAAGGDAPASESEVLHSLERAIAARVGASLAPSLMRVINATGVILHTNLGRAPLAADALAHASGIGSGYSNLEYDLDAGTRGHRHTHAERLVCDLTGAEAALVANNNAGATLLVLAALAEGREVIVSRGELVEIGGGFRIPDVLRQSGARLREVGTTNRTRRQDYAAAIGDRTALLLRVHPSNFRIEGFTERPSLSDLGALARQSSVPLFEDLGSGWLGLADVDTPAALHDEPSVRSSLQAGAAIVAFSGDKLLGGPQAGIVAGRRDLIDRVRRHPLMRALRADKITYAVLEATLALWAQAPLRRRIPVYRMLTMPLDEIDRRARAIVERLTGARGVHCDVRDGMSVTGGGSAPESSLPTRLVSLAVDGLSAAALEQRLRRATPPVVARIEADRVVLDLRTVQEDEDEQLLAALGGRRGSNRGQSPV
jgi:L-seryl-tRNA(Ser) seleniumtransferase